MKTKIREFMIAFVLIAILSMFYGCTESISKDTVIKHSNRIYVSIKVILSDKDVSPLISDAVRIKLLDAEEKYLVAIKALENTTIGSDQGIVSVGEIVDASDVIIEILETFELPDEYSKKIAAIRVVLKVLRVQLE